MYLLCIQYEGQSTRKMKARMVRPIVPRMVQVEGAAGSGIIGAGVGGSVVVVVVVVVGGVRGQSHRTLNQSRMHALTFYMQHIYT